MISKELIQVAAEYYKQNNSLKETAEFMNKLHRFEINLNTLGYHLKKSGLILRSKTDGTTITKRKHIDISKLLEEYEKSVPIRELSRKYKIGRKTIAKILRENNIEIKDSRSAMIAMGHIQEKQKIFLSLQEKAYLYGLVMGDLTPVRKSPYTLKLITHSTHTTFMKLLVRTFEQYGISNYKATKLDGMFRFQCHIDMESFSFLLDTKNEKIPSWINSENLFYFLAGFIDSDGSVIVKKSGANFQYVIRFFGQQLNLLLEIKQRLEALGFNLSIHRNHKKGDTSYHNGIKFKYNKDYYVLETYKKEQTLNLLDKIPIRHPEKRAKIELMKKIQKEGYLRWTQIEEDVKGLKTRIKQSVLEQKEL